MPNAQKELIVSELRDIVGRSSGAILTEYRGLTVAEVTDLRKRLRAADAEYHIVKNTLFKIAVGDEAGAQLDTLLAGPTAIVFSRSDIVAPTKAMLDFLREIKKPEIKLKGGWIDGKIYNVEQVTALSKLPPREQLVAQLIGSLNAPASNLVGTLNNIIGEFVRTVQAIADKRGGEGGAEAPAPAA
jgi:large subunit ribosomal protein L10